MKEQLAAIMDLADFLKIEVDKSSLRKLAKSIGVDKNVIDAIIKRKLKGFPSLETLVAIAEAYPDYELDEIQRMAGVIIPQPKTDAETAERLGRIVNQVPDLGVAVEQLRDLYLHDPSYVRALIVSLEHSIEVWNQSAGAAPDLPPEQ